MMKCYQTLLVCLFVLAMPSMASAVQSYHVGVLETDLNTHSQQDWTMIADNINRQLSDAQLIVEHHSIDTLKSGLIARRFDFVFTTPLQYIDLKHTHNVFGPIATQVLYADNNELAQSAGVIASLTKNADINRLDDLANKTIGASTPFHVPSYYAQIFELSGHELDPSDLDVHFYGPAQKNVLRALISGEIDIAFLDAGVIERAIALGEVSKNDINVIQPIVHDGFPYITSTNLYPHAPFVALSHVPKEVVRDVSHALLNIQLDNLSFAGFTQALDYDLLEQHMQEFNVAPFDVKASLADLVNQHFRLFISLVLFAAVVIVLGFIIAKQNFSLRKSQAQNEAYLKEIERRHQLLRSTFTAIPDLVWIKSPKGEYMDCNTRYESFLGKKRVDVIGTNDFDHFDHAEAIETAEHDHNVLKLKLPSIGEHVFHFKSDGHEETLEIIKAPIISKNNEVIGLLGVGRDITHRKEAERALRLSNEVFINLQEGIIITDKDGYIVDVNPGFSDITGYSKEEAVGQHPSFLNSGRQDESFYQNIYKSLVSTGSWKGELWNRKKDGQIYAEHLSISTLLDEDKAITQFYVGVFTDVTQHKLQQEQLSLMAHYDPLTELPNRTLFADRFQQAILHSQRNDKLLAVCFIDLDNFKPVNDTYGHEMGDTLLIEVGKRLLDSVRGDDTVSRFGGDEFAVLLNDLDSVRECKRTLDRILHKLETPFIIDDHTHYISASIGATLYPSDDQDIDTLLRHADQAMYQAKMSGKHRYYLFDSAEDKVLSAKQVVLEEVKKGLHAEEFQLFYQPKVDMISGDVIGAEALIRWFHPEKGMIPPIDFLPYIDSTDLDIDLGEWVIRQAVEQLHIWQQQGINLEVSVNIASHHLQQPSFVARLAYALDEYPDVAPERLQLEVLESSILSDLSTISQTIQICCDDLGVTVALDDFGTGYSSLTHLRTLEASTVKLDKSFIQRMLDDPNDYMIVDGVIGLAESFDRSVIAEGVESTEHGLMLLAMGCQYGQGFGIGRPMPADQIPKWLANYTPNQHWQSFGNSKQSLVKSRTMLLELTFNSWHNRFTDKITSQPEDTLPWPCIKETCHVDVWMKNAHKERLFDSLKLAEVSAKYTLFRDIADELYDFYESGEELRARSHLPRLAEAAERVKISIFALYPETLSVVEVTSASNL